MYALIIVIGMLSLGTSGAVTPLGVYFSDCWKI